MPLIVNKCDELSLLELVRKRTAGWMVEKTPHIGNHYGNNLGMALIGALAGERPIRMTCCDFTIGDLDKNFHPHTIIRNGERTVIADGSRLTTHSGVTSLHMQKLRAVIPDGEYVVYSKHLYERRELAAKVLRVVTEKMPGIWYRFVQSDGAIIRPDTYTNWLRVEGSGIFSVTNREQGWIIPNAANILLDAIIGVVETGHDTVYELSGPDMIRYIWEEVPKLSLLYDVVRSALPELTLPETLVYQIVPVADVRFVVPVAQRDALDALLHVYHQQLTNEELRGVRMRDCSPEERRALVPDLQRARRADQEALLVAKQNCPEIFYQIKDGTFFSQHDLEGPGGLYVHPWAVETPLVQVNAVSQALMRFGAVK